MISDLRTLLDRHLGLLRAELRAIAREALALLIGSIIVVTLLTGVVVLVAGALVVAAGDALYGSPYFGVALLVVLLLGLAAWIPVVLLGVDRGRRERRRAVLPALAVTVIVSLAALALGLERQPAAGFATLAGLTAFALALAASLRRLDRGAIADRFYPHVSEAELRATVAEAETLLGRRTDDHHG